MILHIQIWGSVLASLVLSCHLAASAQSLSEVVAQAVKTNPDVDIAAHDRLAADQRVKQAQGGYYPTVDLGLGAGRERSKNSTTQPGSVSLNRRESSIAVSQMLFDGFAVKSDVDRNLALADAAAYSVADTSERIGLRAAQAYLTVLRRQELLTLTQDNLTVHQRALDQIKMRADSGVGRKADLDQAQARLALAMSNLESAQANLREAQINYQRVVGNLPGTLEKPAEVACNCYPDTLAAAVDTAAANNPAYRAAVAAYEARLANVQRAKAAYSPKLHAELEATRNDNLDGVDGNNDDESAMLRMRYNLFRGGSDQARVAEADFLGQQEREAALQIRQDIEESVRLSWTALDASRQRLPLLQTYAESAERTRDAYAKQFSIGQRTLLDLLDSENELFKARSEYVDEQYGERSTRYRLLAELGELLNTLGVAPRDEAKVTKRQ